MIGIVYLNGMNVFGNKPWEIEGFDEAISSEEMYVPHHVLEWKYSVEELKQMNRYDKVKADELIWVSRTLHNGNRYIHKTDGCWDVKLSEKKKRVKLSEEHKLHLRKPKSITHTEPKTEFGIKFKQHFSTTRSESNALYLKESRYYKKHGKCSWEE